MYLPNIFIDLDGPILDVSERHYQVYKQIIFQLGGFPLEKRMYWRLKREKRQHRILQLSKITDKKEKFVKMWLNLIEKRSYLECDRVFPNIKNTLNALKKQYNLILVTLRNHPKNLFWQLKILSLKPYFKDILCQKENKGNWLSKYRLIKGYDFFDPSSYLIGDTEIDILAGKKLKIKTIAVLSGIRDKNILLSYQPDYIIDSLKEIWKVLKR